MEYCRSRKIYMSLNHSPSIVTDGLILALDAANRKSYIGAAPASLINTNSWTIGSGSVDGYGQNGNTEENTRLYDTDPWGNQSIVWGTYASGDNGADGGWNTNYVSIDPTKLYRFSVWVRRTSSTAGGTFYFGTGAGGGEVRGTSDSATKGNPYWECSGTGFVQNQWHLVCGHIYPHFSTYTGRHPNTGYFTIATGANTLYAGVNGCNIGSDLKWDSASSSAVHRTYHYYCGDATTRLQFFAPRIDMCDGNEPSISELLSNGSSVCKDLSGNTRTLAFVNSPATSYTSANGGALIFNGINSYISCGNFGSFYPQGTVSFWMNSAAIASYPNPFSTHFQGVNVGFRFEGRSDGNFNMVVGNDGGTYTPHTFISSGMQANTWYNITFVWNVAANNVVGYLNAVQVFNESQTYWATTMPSVTIGNGFSSDRYWNGKISCTQIYNRALSAAEVAQNFNALRGRYGI